MSSPLRITIATVLSGAALASLAALSQAPYRPPGADGALLRLSWRVRGIRVQECRRPRPEELEALPPHMRREEVCEGRIAPYRLRVRVDGRLLEDTLVHAAGAREDRPVYVFREFRVAPGVHRVEIEFVRSVGRGEGEGEWRDEGSGRDRDREHEGGREGDDRRGDDRGRGDEREADREHEAYLEREARREREADQRGAARDGDRARDQDRERDDRARDEQPERDREHDAAGEDDRGSDRPAARHRNGESPARLEFEATVDLAAGDVALITYDPERRALVVRRGARR